MGDEIILCIDVYKSHGVPIMYMHHLLRSPSIKPVQLITSFTSICLTLFYFIHQPVCMMLTLQEKGVLPRVTLQKQTFVALVRCYCHEIYVVAIVLNTIGRGRWILPPFTKWL